MAVACVVAMLSALALPGGASAKPAPGRDDPTDTLPDRLGPSVSFQQAPAKGGGVSTQSYAAPNLYRIHVSSGLWAGVRNAHQQFFIGSAKEGMQFNSNNSYSYSRFGYLPDRNFCGWVLAESLDPLGGSGTSPCPSSWTLPLSGFTQFINSDSCNCGWAATLATSVTYRRNVYPWHTGPGVPSGGITDTSISRPAGYVVYWRYVSENGEWVAVADPDPSLVMNWFFVPRSALPGICPGGAGPSGWGPYTYTCGP